MVPSEILLTIYNGLIKPHILYGLKCWGFNQERIIKLQKKAMRIICLCGYLSHSGPLLEKLTVLKIDGMFKLQLVTFCFDLINNNLPAYFINIYVFTLTTSNLPSQHQTKTKLLSWTSKTCICSKM